VLGVEERSYRIPPAELRMVTTVEVHPEHWLVTAVCITVVRVVIRVALE
jgi:hypothetical protein